MFFLIQKTKYMIVPTAAVRKMMQIGFHLYLAAGALSVKDPYWFFHYHRHQAGSDYLQRVSASVLSFGQHTGHCPDWRFHPWNWSEENPFLSWWYGADHAERLSSGIHEEHHTFQGFLLPNAAERKRKCRQGIRRWLSCPHKYCHISMMAEREHTGTDQWCRSRAWYLNPSPLPLWKRNYEERDCHSSDLSSVYEAYQLYRYT